MSPAERKADQKAAKKALKLQYEHAKEVIDTFNSLVACDAAVSTTEEEICQGCSKVLPRRDQHYVCFSCKHKFKSKFCVDCLETIHLDVCSSCKHKFCEECEIDNLDMCPACEKRFCQKCDDLSGIGCRQCQDAALMFGFM